MVKISYVPLLISNHNIPTKTNKVHLAWIWNVKHYFSNFPLESELNPDRSNQCSIEYHLAWQRLNDTVNSYHDILTNTN